MSSRHLVDAELLAVLDLMPQVPFTTDSLPALRAMMADMIAGMTLPDLPVSIEEIWAPGRDGAVRALLFRPLGASGTLPAVLDIHGGGYVIGAPEMSRPGLMALAHDIQCLILSVDYRLAPDTPFPGPLEDCYAALACLHDQAQALGIDATRIAVSGSSAGGGLAAALCLLAGDRGDYSIAFQQLEAPMLDDRTCTRADPHPLTGEFVWTADHNRFGWTALLGDAPGGEDVSAYATPARAVDLSRLPPAFISVGALDLFLEEDMDYARKLSRAGVPAELHVAPGATHGFAMAGESAVTKRIRSGMADAFRRALSV